MKHLLAVAALAAAAPYLLAPASAAAVPVATRSYPVALAGAAVVHYGDPASARASLLLDAAARWQHAYAGPVRRSRFTFTLLDDQACVTYRHRVGQVRPGPCIPADRQPRTTPLRYAARAIGHAALARANHDGSIGRAATVRFMGRTATLFAPTGVHVSGVRDANGDRYDDDARVTFSVADRAVCAELPLRPGGRYRVYPTACRQLPARALPPVGTPGAGEHPGTNSLR